MYEVDKGVWNDMNAIINNCTDFFNYHDILRKNKTLKYCSDSVYVTSVFLERDEENVSQASNYNKSQQASLLLQQWVPVLAAHWGRSVQFFPFVNTTLLVRCQSNRQGFLAISSSITRTKTFSYPFYLYGLYKCIILPKALTLMQELQIFQVSIP